MTLVGSPVFASGVKATFTTSSIYLAGHVWIPRHFGGIQARLGLRSHCDADCTSLPLGHYICTFTAIGTGQVSQEHG
jgi:hypothetical protein